MTHEETHDRLICDRRPQQFVEPGLGWARLPHVTCLCHLVVDDDEEVIGSGDDLKHFFYT